MSQAHPKLRALAGLALGASLVIAGCGEPADGVDSIDEGLDSTALERIDAASAHAQATGQATGQVVGVVAKPAPSQPPPR